MSRKLYFKYGSMGSGKTLDLIRVVYNYTERGLTPIVFKSNIDTREGVEECIINSRTGFNIKGDWLHDGSIYKIITNKILETKANVVIIDEAQFLLESQIDELQTICYTFNIPIICYGLLVDFQRHLFPGSKRLMEIADDKQELIGICHCGRKAVQNARVVNGVMVVDGDVVKIGGSDKEDDIYYVALCNKCFLKKDIGRRGEKDE